MEKKLGILLLCIVIVPIALLLHFGQQSARETQQGINQEITNILSEKLSSIAVHTQDFWQEQERDLLHQLQNTSRKPDTLQEFVRSNLSVTQILWLNPKGKSQYPNTQELLSHKEKDFLQRLQNTALFSQYQQTDNHNESQQDSPKQYSGWYLWAWGDKRQWLFWWKDPEQNLFIVELNSIYLLSELIALLPASKADTPDNDFRIRLLDEQSHLIYQWGNLEQTGSPQASLRLQMPLQNWQIEYYLPPEALNRFYSPEGPLRLYGGLLIIALLLSSIALYIYREQTRAMREASEKVNFVNQVSHELKTPLTNIRMYAELLAMQLGFEQEQEKLSKIQIIVSESQRLSRLINNVLNFARSQKHSLHIHPQSLDPDLLMEKILESFIPGFEQRHIVCHWKNSNTGPLPIDGDIFEQIVGNLLSNVEKYAPDCELSLSLWQEKQQLYLQFCDNGPGIGRKFREAIFTPFYRISNHLTEGVSGTGIGLSIARDLARLHGGDLCLLPDKSTTCFLLTLQIQNQPGESNP